jgi:hypothetical protein
MKRRYYMMDFLPALLDLFAIERRVTSKMIAGITGHYQGGDAVVALRDNGLELVVVGFGFVQMESGATGLRAFARLLLLEGGNLHLHAGCPRAAELDGSPVAARIRNSQADGLESWKTVELNRFDLVPLELETLGGAGRKD